MAFGAILAAASGGGDSATETQTLDAGEFDFSMGDTDFGDFNEAPQVQTKSTAKSIIEAFQNADPTVLLVGAALGITALAVYRLTAKGGK